MRLDWTTKLLLLMIVIFLGVLVFRPMIRPEPVFAQGGGEPYPFSVQPGTVTLRKPDGTQTWGKVVVDMRNGNVWGFPMKPQNTPYPVYGPSDNPPVSHPMYLGQMAFSEATR